MSHTLMSSGYPRNRPPAKSGTSQRPETTGLLPGAKFRNNKGLGTFPKELSWMSQGGGSLPSATMAGRVSARL